VQAVEVEWDEAKSTRASSLRERPTAVSTITTVRARINGDRVYLIAADGSETPLVPEIDRARLDAADAAEIARQIAADDAEARAAAAAHIRGLRARTGLSQAAFARRLDVSAETLRNWEQGKRLPQGPARALLRIIDKAPDTAMAALGGVMVKKGRVPLSQCRIFLQ
jgi:putative transcriptional regulator